MALSSTPYNGARTEIGKGSVNLLTSALKMLLTTSAYVPNVDTHKYLTDVIGEVASVSGYVRRALAATWIQDNTNDRTVLSSAAVAWPAVGGPITARYAILFVDTGVPATSLLLAVILLDTTPADVTASDGGTLTLTPDATYGWLRI